MLGSPVKKKKLQLSAHVINPIFYLQQNVVNIQIVNILNCTIFKENIVLNFMAAPTTSQSKQDTAMFIITVEHPQTSSFSFQRYSCLMEDSSHSTVPGLLCYFFGHCFMLYQRFSVGKILGLQAGQFSTQTAAVKNAVCDLASSC